MGFHFYITTAVPGDDLQAAFMEHDGRAWVYLRSGNEELTIYLESAEHARRITEAVNWRPPVETAPLPVCEQVCAAIDDWEAEENGREEVQQGIEPACPPHPEFNPTAGYVTPSGVAGFSYVHDVTPAPGVDEGLDDGGPF